MAEDTGQERQLQHLLEELAKATGQTEQELLQRLQPVATSPDAVQMGSPGAVQMITPPKRPALGMSSPSPVPVPPGRSSARPVCWSLHKYFKSSSEEAGPGTAVGARGGEAALAEYSRGGEAALAEGARGGEAALAKGTRGIAALQAEQAAEQLAVSEVRQLLPDSLQVVLQRPAHIRQRQRGGRPRKAASQAKGSYCKRLSAREKLDWVDWILHGDRPGMKGAVAHAARQTGACWQAVRNWVANRQRLNQYVLDHSPGKSSPRQNGCSTPRVMLPVRHSVGCRLAGPRGYLGRTDHCRPLVLAVQTWAEVEEASGHSLARADLLRQFRRYLDQAVQDARKKEEEGTLTAEGKKALTAWLQKQASLEKGHNKRLKQPAYLVARTGFTERQTNRQTKLSQAEEDKRLQWHWQYWDRAVWLAGCAPAAALAEYVAKPEQFVQNREFTALTFSDQIPVWLKPGAGKILQSRRMLKKAAASAKQRRAARSLSSQSLCEPAAQPEEAVHEHSHARGPGDAAADRPLIN